MVPLGRGRIRNVILATTYSAQGCTPRRGNALKDSATMKRDHRPSTHGGLKPLRPVLRWAGGKHRLTPALMQLLPEAYERLVEPMVGSAALFFACGAKQAILGDSNSELINFYRVLANRTDELINRLLSLKASRTRYYELRNLRPRGELDRAVRFAYLNRLCWNGLYRVNREGGFNVPIGSRLPSRLWDENHLRCAAAMLRSAELVCGDFELTLKFCKSGDVVYLDPPYPKTNKDSLGFNRYTPAPFSAADHERLARAAIRLHRRGVRVIVSTGSSEAFLSLFPRDFRVIRVTSSSLIACNGSARGPVRETILRNYDGGQHHD